MVFAFFFFGFFALWLKFQFFSKKGARFSRWWWPVQQSINEKKKEKKEEVVETLGSSATWCQQQKSMCLTDHVCSIYIPVGRCHLLFQSCPPPSWAAASLYIFPICEEKISKYIWSIFFFFSLSKRQQLSKAFIPHKIEKGNVVSLFSDGQNSAGVYIYFCIWSFYSFGKVGGTHFLLHFW